MNPVIIYSTKTGNTEKVAVEIAQELNCQAINLSTKPDFSTISLNDFDFVFLGTWIRGGEPSPDVISFLKQLNLKDSNRQFALFMTWAGGGKSDVLAFNRVKQLLEAKTKNYIIATSYVLANLGLAKRGHPDAQDLAEARKCPFPNKNLKKDNFISKKTN